MSDALPRVGVSSCLLGEAVRFDAGHKRDLFLTDHLAHYVEFVPRCPEMAIGLGIPREPIHLVRTGDKMDAISVRSAQSVGVRLREYGEEQARALSDLCGYIFKSKSPSCGIGRVAVFGEDGQRTGGHTRGLYAQAITATLPWLPVEDEGRLRDTGLRDSFLVRVFTLDRLRRSLFEQKPTARALIDFHTDHKFLLLAHNVAAYKRLGQLVARAGCEPLEPLSEVYRDELMAALAHPARIPRHVNVLQHLLGYLRDRVDAGDRAELLSAIEDFRTGTLPWFAVRLLFRHHFRRHPDDFINRQVYLQPYPDELAAL
ncbi:MAG: DUF523 and DUF1722 domain-containing protein [Gammaproteobacteria bacterium]